jgi:uncharacterized membrane protein YkoI
MEKLSRKYTQLASAAAAVAAAALLTAPAASAFTGEKYGHEAKISLPQAREIAQKAFHGKIVSEELERERGGSGLRYSFDIRRGSVTQEVGVDAKTGKVLENDREGPNPD